jgi:hypothetical protein
MHDIKYFFLDKNNQTIREEGEQIFFPWRDRLPRVFKSTIFQNPDGLTPHGSASVAINSALLF